VEIDIIWACILDFQNDNYRLADEIVLFFGIKLSGELLRRSPRR